MKVKTLAFFSLIIWSFPAFAEIGVEDPTRPIYMAPVVQHSEGESGIEKQAHTAIPPLTQLVYGPKRQIAMFGSLVVREGDATPFGTIVEIKNDRVLVMDQEQINEVKFAKHQASLRKDLLVAATSKEVLSPIKLPAKTQQNQNIEAIEVNKTLEALQSQDIFEEVTLEP